jgi:hypothetical protein
MPKDKSKKKAAEPDIETPATKSKDGKKDKGEKADKPKASAGDLVGPGSGGNFVAKDVIGELLLITPTELVKDMQTSASKDPSDAIRADIVVLDKKTPKKSEVIEGGLIFQKVLQGQLRESLAKGTRVVGTLIQDEASKKAGQSAPYRLTAPTDADIDVARQYLDALNPLR